MCSQPSHRGIREHAAAPRGTAITDSSRGRDGVSLSAILAQSATAFTVVKLLGAAYLAYLGLRLILARAGPDAGAALAAEAPSRRRSASPYVQES